MESSLSPLPPSDLEGKRVVIVEDEGIVQLQLRKLLQREGMEIVGEAGSGAEAIEVVLATRPDIVLMDINIPGMNGLEAMKRILAEYSVCIMMMSAYSKQEYISEAEEGGACGYLTKPYTKELLLSQLRAAFHKYFQERSPKDEG